MKISFSTNGWDEFEWQDFYTMAKDLEFDGIEIHHITKDTFTDKKRPFHSENIIETYRTLANLNLEIPCIDVTCDIADATQLESNVREIETYIEMASHLQCTNIRLRAGKEIEGENIDDQVVIDCISRVRKKAANENVNLLIETVGPYRDTKRLRSVLMEFARDNVAALWDVYHTSMIADEDIELTVQNLGAFIRHVHIKDAVKVNGSCEYRMMGEGSIPMDEVINGLNSINYEGFVSLEWRPMWLAELAAPGVVFPHYANFMSRYGVATKVGSHLYSNNTGTGEFIWQKDELIDLTFPQVLDRVVEEFPDQYAFRYTTLDYTRTYSEFRDDVDQFARALIALGVKPGSHVAAWATNLPQWYIAFWATTKIGAVLVTVNTAYKVHEAEYLLRHSDTHTLIMIDGYRDSNYAQIMNEICPELQEHKPGGQLHSKRLPFLRNIINISSKQPGCLTWDEALSFADSVPVEEVYRREAAIDKHDVCNMQYTSGTTGFPKGVMLTHYNVVNNGKCIGDRMDLSTADRMMIQVPMFHCFGMVLAMTASMTHGVSISPLPYFSTKPALACINQERITCFHGVPTMFIAMLEHPDFEHTDFSYMRTGIMAGSPCPISVMLFSLCPVHFQGGIIKNSQ